MTPNDDLAGLDPVQTLTTTPDLIQSIAGTGQFGKPLVAPLPQTGDWIATIALPLTTKIVVFAGTVIMAGYTAALVFQAADIF